MTAAFVIMTMAVFVLLVSIGLLALDNMQMAINAKDAQIKAARVLAFYEASFGENNERPRQNS